MGVDSADDQLPAFRTQLIKLLLSRLRRLDYFIPTSAYEPPKVKRGALSAHILRGHAVNFLYSRSHGRGWAAYSSRSFWARVPGLITANFLLQS